MPAKNFDLPGIGKVKIYKRRGSRGLRLTLHPEHYVRVTMPNWLPYKVGLDFVRSKKAWINSNRRPKSIFRQDMKIGKQHRLQFIPNPSQSKIKSTISQSTVTLYYPTLSSITDTAVQNAAKTSSLQALKKESGVLLQPRLDQLALKYGYSYDSLRLRYLKSRWGSCTSKGDITLNTMLLTLPWELIDHVLLHELLHTKILKHGSDFWAAFEKIAPGARQRQKQLRHYQPHF